MAKVDATEVVAIFNLVLSALEKLAAIAKDDPEVWNSIRDDWRNVSSQFDDAVEAELAKRGEAEK